LQINHHGSIQSAQQKSHKANMQAARPGVTYLYFLKLSLQPLQIFLQSVSVSLMLLSMLQGSLQISVGLHLRQYTVAVCANNVN